VGVATGLAAAADFAKAVTNFIRPLTVEHVVSVTNLAGSRMRVKCASKDNTIGPTDLEDKKSLVFKFKQNFFRTTHFWCDVWWKNKWQVFPAFGGGAPKNKINDFRVYGNIGNGYGVYLGGSKFKPWA